MKPSAAMPSALLGTIPVEEELMLDLHGKNLPRARRAVAETLEAAKQRGVSRLTVVTGRGNHLNPDGSRGVLKAAFPSWVSDEEHAAAIKHMRKDLGAYELTLQTKQSSFVQADRFNLKNRLQQLLLLQRGGIEGLRRSAEKGNPADQTLLGLILLRGHDSVKQDVSEAVKWIQEAADKQQHAEAQVLLGEMHAKGEGVQQSHKLAFQNFQKAAAQKDPSGIAMVAKCYLLGQGIRQSDEQALACLKEGDKLNCPFAQLNLGRLYANGYGVKEDDQEANHYYRKAANQGLVIAQVELAKNCLHGRGFDKPDHEQAFHWFEKAALAGNALGLYYLGYAFANGQGVAQDNQKAFKWFMRAAEQGDADAQVKVSYALLHGKGTAPNVKEAIAWLEKAKAQNCPESFYLEGVMYSTGNALIKKDKTMALKCFEHAAELGYVEAQKLMGLRYLSGKGVVQNMKTAQYWLKKAADAEDPQAEFFMGFLLDDNQKDSPEAFKWYEKSARHGDVQAQVRVALSYLNGFDVERNVDRAFYWFNEAAKQGDREGLFYLGIMHVNGFGCTKNDKQAVIYFQQAADKGYADAQACLAYHYEHGEGVKVNLPLAIFWYEKAEGNGNEYARKNLNSFYTRFAVELMKKEAKDYTQPIAWLRKAAEKGYADAEFLLGALCTSGDKGVAQDEKQAVAWFEKAGLHGNAQAAMYMVGFYMEGNGRAANPIANSRQGLKWLQHAAQLGHPAAIQMLQQMHAALQGHPAASVAQNPQTFLKPPAQKPSGHTPQENASSGASKKANADKKELRK